MRINRHLVLLMHGYHLYVIIRYKSFPAHVLTSHVV